MPRSAKIIPSEWSLKIEGLRHNRKLSQAEFGAQLGVSAMAVSRWERGAAEPTGETYIRLGTMAGDPLCWFFWRRTGLRLSDVTNVLPAARRRLANSITPQHTVRAGSAKKYSLKQASFVAIPVLAVRVVTADLDGDNIDLAESPPECVLPFPTEWCPNPSSTVCLKVKGNSMSPLILDGYIIAVDTSEVQSDTLVGQIVVAAHKEKGLLVSRLIRFDNRDALVSDQREYESVPAMPGSEWRIVGKVLWWTGHAR